MQQLTQRLPSRSWRAKRQFRLWWREHRRQLRYALVGLAALAAVLEVVQLTYPSGKMLPFAHVEGQKVHGNVADATDQLDQDYANAKLVVRTAKKNVEVTLADAGVRLKTRQSAEAAASYPLWQRMIPFSLFTVGALRDTPMQVRYDNAKLEAFATRVEAEGHADAINASIIVRAGKAKVVPSTPTKDYPAQTVITALREAHYRPKTTVSPSPRTQAAPLTDEEARAMVDEVQRLVNDPLHFTLEGKTFDLKKGTRGDWLTFAPDAAFERLSIGLNTELVRKYLESIQGDAYKAPGTTHVQLIDDREVSRAVGLSGRGVDADKAIAAIDEAIKSKGESTVALHITDLPPVLAYDKKYSNTDAALASLVAGVATSKGGYGVSLMEIDGRSANANGNKRFVAASTYKLYVAYAVVKEVEAGRLSWSESLGARTVAECFDDMIVVSDNSCPAAFGSRIGWSRINTMIHDLGVSSSTQLGSGMYTTPNDLAYFLYRLEKGSLLSKAGTDRLIDAMKRQNYTRAGIPKGAGGVVADKVGEVDGYYHDAAIVYGSKKTYVLIVMTYGGSWAGIADVASQVHAAVNK